MASHPQILLENGQRSCTHFHLPIGGGRADYSEQHALRRQHHSAAARLHPIADGRDQRGSLSYQAC